MIAKRVYKKYFTFKKMVIDAKNYVNAGVKVVQIKDKDYF